MGEKKRYSLNKASKEELKKYSDSLFKSIEALAFIDYMHHSLGWSRQERRTFWNTFVKSPAYRTLYLEQLSTEIAVK